MTVMDDPVKPKITFSHQTLTTSFLDPRNLKKLKNNLKSLGTQDKQLNHYLQTTYRIINDLESAQAEHRRRPKHVRTADKDYVNTVEFVRLVAEIVAGHILNAVCGGSVGSPKSEDGIAERLLNELVSHTRSTDGGTQDYTHGDHIRLGVVNAVAEMLTTAKGTGGLPVVENVAKTTLSSEAEAERRRRGAAAAASLAAGKNKYDYCGTGKLNPRVQASRNKKYELSKFERRKSNNRLTDTVGAGEKRTSSDGIQNGANSRAVIKAQNRPKPDKSGNEKEQGTASTQNVARKVQLEKPVGSRTGQIRPTNVNRNNYASKVNSRKTVGDDLKSGKSNNINVMVKSQDRIPRETTIGGNSVNNTRSQKRRVVVRRGVTMQPQKNISRRKPETMDEPKTGSLGRIDTRKSKSNTVDPKSNTMNSRNRRVATRDDRKKLPTNTTDKNRRPGPTGGLLKEVVGTTRTRGKTPLANVEGNDDKSRKLYNRNKTFLDGSGIVEKSKTAGNRNGGAAVVKKSKTAGNRNGDTAIVEKSKTAGNRNGGAGIMEKSKTTGNRSSDIAIVEKSKTTGNRNSGASIEEKSKTTGDRNGDAAVVEKSKTAGNRSSDTAIVDKSKAGGTSHGEPAIVDKSKTAGTRNGGVAIGEKSKITGTRNGGAGIMEKSKTTGTRNGGAGIMEKSKTTGTRNGGTAIGEKSKTTGTRNGGAGIMEKSKTTGTRNGGAAIVEKSKIAGAKNGSTAIVKKSKTSGTRNSGSAVEKSKNAQPTNDISEPRPDGKRDETMPTSETLISPAIDYHDDASLTATRDRINEPNGTKKIFSTAETIGGSPLAPTDVRDDDNDDSGGVKNMVNRDTGNDRIFDEQDLIRTRRDLVETRQDQVESKADKAKTRAYNAETGVENSETGMDDAGTGPNNARTGTDNDKTDQDNSETICNRINEGNQDETGQTMTTSIAVDGACSCRTDNSCIGDNKYKLRMSYVLDQLRQCQNQQTGGGLYQAKRKCSKYEVTDITEEEYCKHKNIFNKQTKK